MVWRMHAASFPENTIGYAAIYLVMKRSLNIQKVSGDSMCPCRRSSTLLIDLMSTVVDLSSIPFR